jgi:hypothetical protein
MRSILSESQMKSKIEIDVFESRPTRRQKRCSSQFETRGEEIVSPVLRRGAGWQPAADCGRPLGTARVSKFRVLDKIVDALH